ncbi:MAG TPA: 4-hydroxybenzoate 3-monooxygenase, partial [Dermatophilaceae bacterium]|nr:4-hydroxybenzoate 3-monooxygenase [Dermatophilaceae bacterium]
VGESVWLYPQQDVFIDLADARARDGGDVRFGVRDVAVDGIETEQPTVSFTEADGTRVEVRADYVIGSDGSRSVCRDLVPEQRRVRRFREYPFAWFGILAEAPVSSPELIYCNSDSGFALISQRTATVQRMYFQCDPAEDVEAWTDERIWERLQSCLEGGDGFRLHEGPVIQKSVLPFRSFVQEPMRWGRLLLAGDAAHTVPPTGARGLNLAIHDVRILADVLVRAIAARDDSVLEEYAQRALARVWRAQSFSYWMTQMLHLPADGSEFDRRRQLGELDNLVSTRAGQVYLAEQYTGWPSEG